MSDTNDDEEEVIPLTPAGRLLAEHMARSMQASPHVVTLADVDMTEALALLAQYGERIREREGITLDYLPFVLKSAALALRRFPLLNARLDGTSVRLQKRVHLGLTVPTGSGHPFVPVLRDADRKGLFVLAREIEDLSARARSDQLHPDEVRGATFSVTHPGVAGCLLQTPVIHQPQAAILSVGAIFKIASVVGETIVPRARLYLCLASDHRFVDGDTAARFLGDVKRSLEEARFLFL